MKVVRECQFLASTTHHHSIYFIFFERSFLSNVMEDLKAGVSVFCKRKTGVVSDLWITWKYIFDFSITLRSDVRG